MGGVLHNSMAMIYMYACFVDNFLHIWQNMK